MGINTAWTRRTVSAVVVIVASGCRSAAPPSPPPVPAPPAAVAPMPTAPLADASTPQGKMARYTAALQALQLPSAAPATRPAIDAGVAKPVSPVDRVATLPSPPDDSVAQPASAQIAPQAMASMPPPPTVAVNVPANVSQIGVLTATARALADGPVSVPEGQELNDAPALPAPAVPQLSSATAAVPASVAQRVDDARKANPRDTLAQLDGQILRYLQGQAVPRETDLSGLPGEDRELVSAVMDALSNFRDASRSDGDPLAADRIRPFVELAERLRAGTHLTVPRIALCRKVDGFGSYDVIDPARFPACLPVRALVYCEVENFSSNQLPDKRWETSLAQSAMLMSDAGQPMWQDKRTNVVDRCRDQRHDFFMVKLVQLPDNLPPGRYSLHVTLVDQQANRMTEAATPLEIVAR